MSTNDKIQMLLDQLAIWALVANVHEFDMRERLKQLVASINSLSCFNNDIGLDEIVDYLAKKYGFSI